MGEGSVNFLNYNQRLQIGIGMNALANRFIHYGHIDLPYSSNQVVRLFWDQLCKYKPIQSQFDGISWSCSSRMYTTSGMYNFMVTRGVAVTFSWHKRIWLNHNSER